MGDYNLKQISVTEEEFLVDNTFAVDRINDLNIYTFEEGGISEYSQS
jgi:hypothetical protein